MKHLTKPKLFIGIIVLLFISFTLYFLGYPNQKIQIEESEIADKNTPIDKEQNGIGADLLDGENPNQIPKLKGKSNLVFSILKTGEAKTLEGFVIEGGSIMKMVTVSHSGFYIQHPKGSFLFDTGLGTNIKEQFEVFPFYLKILMEYKLIETAKSQLESNGIDHKSINDIFFSHLHWDHASGLKDFPNANIHSVKEELNNPLIELGYIPSQFDGETVKWKHLNFSNKPYASYAKSFDWFGDGTAVFVPMKGHSEGSVGLFLHTENGDVYFLTGDIVWRKEGFIELKHKPRGARWIVDYDTKELGEEITRVHKLIKQNPKLIVVPAHDFDTQEPLGFYPKVIGANKLMTMD
ncbi:MBL fold metallo-hydrolase [Leptospira sp. WS39.C2]